MRGWGHGYFLARWRMFAFGLLLLPAILALEVHADRGLRWHDVLALTALQVFAVWTWRRRRYFWFGEPY